MTDPARSFNQFAQKVKNQPGVEKASPNQLVLRVPLKVTLLGLPLTIRVGVPWDVAGVDPSRELPAPGQAAGRARKAIGEAGDVLQETLDTFAAGLEETTAWQAGVLARLQATLRTPMLLNWPLDPAQVSGILQTRHSEAIREAKAEWETLQAKLRLEEGSHLGAYPALFPKARGMTRKWTAWLGPTNSGKTHSAFERLKAARHGAYLAPLRLMALEGYERLTGEGIACNLRTGEERIDTAGAALVSATIEMASLDKVVDVAIIDEVQMLSDPDRGWAWSQALIGMPATDILLTGSPDVLPLLEKLAHWCGDTLEVHLLERKTPLTTAPSIPVEKIRSGDAVVAFSRADVLFWRDVLGKAGHKVSCIYGALGPEVRRNEAARFRSGEADVIVATDAIGMGLNLPIKRVVLTSGEKYDGYDRRELLPTEVRQIAGRAGRYGFNDAGVAVMLDGSGLREDWLKGLLHGPGWSTDRPYVQAPWSELERIHTHLGIDTLADLLLYAHSQLLDPKTTRPTRLDGLMPLARMLASSRLPLDVQHQYLGCPVGREESMSFNAVLQWARIHGKKQPVRPPHVPASVITSTDGLKSAEQGAEVLTAYLWLALRWPETYTHGEAARVTRASLNDAIEQGLRRANLAGGKRGR